MEDVYFKLLKSIGEDPKREGKPFDCLSCHVPHSSAWGKLFRYEAQNTASLCKNCHDFMQ